MMRFLALIGILCISLPLVRSFVLSGNNHLDYGVSGFAVARKILASSAPALRPQITGGDSQCQKTTMSVLNAVPKRHLSPKPKPNRIESVLRAIASPITKPLAYLQRAIFRFMVYHTSAFMTALLIDPGVNHGIANGIKDGMNLWLTQPNVKTKLLKLQQNLSSDERSLAKATGEDFPKVLVNFLLGILLQDFDPNGRTEDENEEED